MSNLLSITDLSVEDIRHILDLSAQYSQPTSQLQGKNIVFAFEKPSLRTKVATEVAINQLWGNVIHLESHIFYGGKVISVPHPDNHQDSREALKDTVKNVNEWCDALFARVFSHQTLLDIASYSDLSLINALCDQHHPMQAITDLYTIREIYGEAKTQVAFVGDSNNVAFSLAEILLKCGHDVRIASPDGYGFSPIRKMYLEELAVKNGANILLTQDPFAAVKGTDIIYADTFVSMGEEHLYDEKVTHFAKYQVNEQLMDSTGKKTHFMHCLPAHRGIEVTDAVIDSTSSLVYRQAKNRMVTARGVFLKIFWS